MKKLKISLLLISIIMVLASSCKKGENDPFISLKSRDARITAIWNLTKIEGTNDSEVVTYDGSTLSVDGEIIYKNASFEMTIDKDGVMSYSEIKTLNLINSSETTKTGTGFWTWLDANKDKVYITLSCGNPFSQGASTYYVDQLKTGELILKYYDVSATTNSTNTTDLTLTFEKK